MALPGTLGQLKFKLGDLQMDAPREWAEITILSTFDDASQANITTDKFTFVKDEAQVIRQYILDGLTGGAGIFEGLPFEISSTNNAGTLDVFKGFLDLTNDFEDIISNGEVKARIRKSNGLNSLDDRLGALTYGYLENREVFTDEDYLEIEYLVEKKFNAFEILTSAIILYLMIKELAEAIRELVKAIANVIAITASGTTGGIGGTIYAIAIAILILAYVAILTLAINDLAIQMIETFFPPKRKAKVLKLGTALSKVAEFLGFGFETGIEDLDTVFYLPSNPRQDDIDLLGFISVTHGPPVGIPHVKDFGYSVIEMFGLCEDLFAAKIAIVDGVIHFRNIDDPFWIQTSTYVMPSILIPTTRYNTAENIANRLFTFDTDIMDDWTIDNYTGTTYEVITDAILVNNPDAKYLLGLDSIRWPVVLGNRKDKLNALEEFLKGVASAMDDIVGFFGGSSNLVGKINSRVGLLRISTNNWTKPKLLKLTDGTLTAEHRANWSAKYLYETYHIGKSFVSNNFFGQKIDFKEVEIPFGFNDFIQVIDNSYFTTFDGRKGKIERLKWNIAKDKAIVDFWVRQPYTKNLKETFIEP